MRKSLENMGEYPIFVQKKESNKTNSMAKGANHIELTSEYHENILENGKAEGAENS